MKKDRLKDLAKDTTDKHKLHVHVSSSKKVTPKVTKESHVAKTQSTSPGDKARKATNKAASPAKIEDKKETNDPQKNEETSKSDSSDSKQSRSSTVKQSNAKAQDQSVNALSRDIDKTDLTQFSDKTSSSKEGAVAKKATGNAVVLNETISPITKKETAPTPPSHLNEEGGKKETKAPKKPEAPAKKSTDRTKGNKKSEGIAKQRQSNRFADHAKAYMKTQAVRVTGIDDTELGDIRQVASSTRNSLRVAKQAGKTGGRLAINAVKSPWWLKNKVTNGIQQMKRVFEVVRFFLSNPLMALKTMGLGVIASIIVALVVIVVVTVMSIFPSVSLKNDEKELTATWDFVSQLDAEATLTIRNSSEKELSVNESYAIREDVSIYSNIDSLIYFFDGLYGSYKLNAHQMSPTYFDGKSMKGEITNLHEALVTVTGTPEGESLVLTEPTEFFQKNKKTFGAVEEQLEALNELGQYMSLQELDSPFPKESVLNVSKRYGYHVSGQSLAHFKGITIDSVDNKKVYAPMAGEVLVSGNTITIKNKKKTLKLSNVSPVVTKGDEIKKGQFLGETVSDKGLTITYKKGRHDVNPGFYFPGIQYMQSTNFGFQSSGAGFNEALFRQLISTKCGAFSTKADKIIAEAKKAGVSPVIFAAIMIHESAWGKSTAIITHNNPSGQMTSAGLIHYKTLDEGIEATGRTLHNLIIERKLQTVEALGSVYCPVGALNDPTGLNKNWVPAIKQFMTQLGGEGSMSVLWSEGSASGRAGKMLQFGNELYQKGVIYSQGGQRGTMPYHDCSSFVTMAMKAAGVNIGIGSTETLYSVEGTLLQPISRSEVKVGDIFVWGTKGASGGNYGHTGIFLDNGGKTIIHCTPSVNQKGNVVKTPFEGYYGSANLAPVYFYRVK